MLDYMFSCESLFIICRLVASEVKDTK